MSTATVAAAFFLIWWVVLFAVLPWGVRSQYEAQDRVPGTDPGAPVRPRLGRTILLTTALTVVIFAALSVVYTDRLVTIDGVLAHFGMHFTE